MKGASVFVMAAVLMAGVEIAAARCDELALGAGMTTTATQAVLLEGELPQSATETMAIGWARAGLGLGIGLEAEYRFSGSLRNFQGGSAAGRLREKANGFSAWMDVIAMQQGPLRVAPGLGVAYLSYRKLVDGSASDPSTRSIERSVSARIRAAIALPGRAEMGAWWANGWTYGTGDNRFQQTRYEWQGLSWSAGLTLGVRILE